MFSKIPNSAEAIPENARIEQDLIYQIQSAEQLHSELSTAIRAGMVTTRRQSHGLANDEMREGSEIDTPRNISGKRKNEGYTVSTPSAVPVKRRKTSVEHLDNDGRKPSTHRVPTASRKPRSTVHDDTAGNDIIESHGRKNESTDLDSRQTTPKKVLDEAGKGDCDNAPGVEPKEQRAPSRNNKANSIRAPNIQVRIEVPDSTAGPDSETTGTARISTAPKATHFRFGSEERGVNATNSAKGQVHTDALTVSVVAGSEESDAEDEAPEVVSASVGAERAKARDKEADRAAERQWAAAKEKRRERNEVLRQQANFSKKTKKRTAVEDVDDETGLDHVVDPSISHLESAPIHTKSVTRRPLPALLPDDILSADPATRPATPPSDQEPNRKLKPRNHIFVETDSKPPKDIKRGPFKVRVLEGGRHSLPPKTSKESRNIKESWLAGRRGRNGAAIMERRKVGFGFARK